MSDLTKSDGLRPSWAIWCGEWSGCTLLTNDVSHRPNRTLTGNDSDAAPCWALRYQNFLLLPSASGSSTHSGRILATTYFSRHRADWLFKYPQASTGQHWAEKIAAEVANCLGIRHAVVELADFQGERGSATESFAREGRDLIHGNQLLAGKVHGYNPEVRFRQSDHTLGNSFLSLEKTFSHEAALRRANLPLAGYLVLNALIGNTDRHHENWGLLRKRVGDTWKAMMAPSFDHASSLGRELQDAGQGKSRRRLLAENRVGAYAERARGGVYWSEDEARGLSPLQLVRRANGRYKDVFAPALAKVGKLNLQEIKAVIARVPDDWMTPTAREFAFSLMCYNAHELRKLV